jgi:Ni,Fe-hydrogenase III large subunit
MSDKLEKISSASNLLKNLNKKAQEKDLSPSRVKHIELCRSLMNELEQIHSEIGNLNVSGSASTKKTTQF